VEGDSCVAKEVVSAGLMIGVWQPMFTVSWNYIANEYSAWLRR
jgi:hypothetical protein